MKVRTLYPFTDRTEGKIRRTGDVFDCTPERFDEIERHGHHIEPVPDGEAEAALLESTEYKRFAAMSEDELRMYADRRFKLAFHDGVKKPEMIAAIIERERNHHG